MSINESDTTKIEISLQLTNDELSIINNSLNEVLEVIDNTEFTTRIGGSKLKVEELLSKINLLLGMYNFNQPLDNLPSNLEKLIISAPYKHSLDNLPDSLIYFNYSGFKKLTMKRVPQNLKKIKVNLGCGKIELDNVIVEYY